MTHVEILEGFETIYKRSHKIVEKERKWVDAERARLQKECGKTGHIMGKDRGLFSMGDYRCCAICGKAESTKRDS